MTESTFRVGVKDAVKSAMSFVNEMYEGQTLKDLLLEEVEMELEANVWLVTVGFSLPAEDAAASTLASAGKKARRVYKVVTIDATSGVPLSMKMREI
jgi:hypothetical protein